MQELEESCRTVEALPDLNGQMVEDWFRQVLEACLYGMRQSGETEAPLEEEMDKRFWHCTDMAAGIPAAAGRASRQRSSG